MSRMSLPSDIPYARGGSDSPADYSSSSDSEQHENDDNRPSASKGKGKRRKYVRDPEQRKKILEDDIWTTNITVTSVDCRGCGKTLALDGRRHYYLGLWEKHRDKCAGIRRQKGEEPLPRVITTLFLIFDTYTYRNIISQKQRKTAAKSDGGASTTEFFERQQGRWVDIPRPEGSGSHAPSTSSLPRDYSSQYRASSAEYPEGAKHGGQSSRLPVSRSMESLRAGNPDHPGDELYWRETPFAPRKYHQCLSKINY